MKMASSGFFHCVVWYKFTDVSEVLAALMMEAANTSEVSANFYQTTRRRRQPSP
jgi:outer membrane lipoprotein-sorting protein